MRIIKEKNFNGLNKNKKELLKSLMGVASSKEIDFNKVRDEWNRVLMIREDKVDAFLNQKRDDSMWKKIQQKAELFRKNIKNKSY